MSKRINSTCFSHQATKSCTAKLAENLLCTYIHWHAVYMQAIRKCSMLCHFNAVKTLHSLYQQCDTKYAKNWRLSLVPRPETRLVKTLQTTEVTNGMCSLLRYSSCTKHITWQPSPFPSIAMLQLPLSGSVWGGWDSDWLQHIPSPFSLLWGVCTLDQCSCPAWQYHSWSHGWEVPYSGSLRTKLQDQSSVYLLDTSQMLKSQLLPYSDIYCMDSVIQ